MKKQKIQMLFVLGILILCMGGYFLAGKMPKEEETTVTSDTHTVTNVDKTQVTGMSYLCNGSIIELVKINDIWRSEEDKSLNLDQTIIDNMLSYVCNITSETKITEVNNLDEYGLNNPSNTVCITLEDDSVVQVLIGDYLDITGDNYILLAGDPNVYTLPSYTANSFNKSVEDLIAEEETTEESTQETEEEVTLSTTIAE